MGWRRHVMCEGPRAMHPLTFQFKRAHLRGVAFGKKQVARVPDMTPARFDLLYAIRTKFGRWKPSKEGPNEHIVRQSDIWKFLGLDPSTISKMVKRLKQLGWVNNEERDPRDQRHPIVQLTKLGRKRIEKAMRIVFHQHTHRKMFEAWFKRTHPTGTRDVIESYWESLRGLGLHLEDPGMPLYELYQKKGKPVTLAEEQDLARRKELVHAFCKKVATAEERRRRRDQRYLEKLWNHQEMEYLRHNDWNAFIRRIEEAHLAYLVEMENRRHLGVETTPELEQAKKAFAQAVGDTISSGKPPTLEDEDLVLVFDADAPLEASSSAASKRIRSSPN